jgi:Lrp/AsnC family leucine-responsive transcriptional regulator
MNQKQSCCNAFILFELEPTSMRYAGHELDDVDVHILTLLQDDARMTMRALGTRVGLSGPAATERVRRLEERGILRGYHAEVAPERIGLPVVAFVSLGMAYDVRPSTRLEREIEEIEEVVECYRITGEDAYLLKVTVPDMEALRETLDRLSEFGRARTSVVLSVPKRPAPLRPRPPRPSAPAFRHGAD